MFAVVEIGFLLLVVGCADVLMCCDVDALRRGLFMSCSWNQNQKILVISCSTWQKTSREDILHTKNVHD